MGGNESEEELARVEYVSLVETYVWVLVGSVILVVGTVGNTLVIVVILRRKRMRLSTNGLYLLTLAAVDQLVLFTGLLRHWILFVSDVQVRDLSDASCKIHLYLTYVAAQGDAWILINLTVERVVAVFVPHRARAIFTQPRAALGLAASCAALLLLNVPYLVTFGLRVPEAAAGNDSQAAAARCMPHEGWEGVSNALDWVDFVVASAAPFTIMALSNVAIVVRVLQNSKKRRAKLLGRSSGRLANPTCLLLTVTTTFIVCTAPYSIYISLVNNQMLLEGISSTLRAERLLIGSCLALLHYVNHAINFILYCLMGSRFRRELTALSPCRRSRVAPLPDKESYSLEYSVTTVS